MDNLADRSFRNNLWLIFGAPFAATAAVILVCVFFPPRWETNDDVGMSMVAHGYGMAAVGMPNLIFSNVVWGYIVRGIPEINGILGYSIATLGVLVIVGSVLIYGLLRSGAGYIVCFSIFILILLRPILFPQFTLNAGLLLMAAIICWNLYAGRQDWKILWLGTVLAFFSYLIRDQEFFLVLLVALPLLPWRVFMSSRSMKVACCMLFSAIAAAAFFNHQAYQGDEWKAFNKLNPARAPFTDFGVGGRLLQRPDILKKHGYSENDIGLIGGWFFVDPRIADPEALQSMVAELGPLPQMSTTMTGGWFGIKALWDFKLLSLGVGALTLALYRPSKKMALSWALCIAMIFLMGVMGRPGVVRVYLPLLSLLLVAPIILDGRRVAFKRFHTYILLAACLFSVCLVIPESKAAKAVTERTKQDLINFPHEQTILWAATFPYESAYPVLGAPAAAMQYRLYALGTFTLAPFSVAYAETRVGNGMVRRLVGDEGILIVAGGLMSSLDVYCKERLNGKLENLSSVHYGDIVVDRERCNIKP